MIEENSAFNEHLESLETETKELKSEIHFLKRSLNDAEQIARVSRNESVEYAKLAKTNPPSCSNCKGKTQTNDLKLDNS